MGEKAQGFNAHVEGTTQSLPDRVLLLEFVYFPSLHIHHGTLLSSGSGLVLNGIGVSIERVRARGRWGGAPME